MDEPSVEMRPQAIEDTPRALTEPVSSAERQTVPAQLQRPGLWPKFARDTTASTLVGSGDAFCTLEHLGHIL